MKDGLERKGYAMVFQEPRVVFVPIEMEVVAEASVDCNADTLYNCEDSQVQASWEGCGCSDGLNEDLVPCDDIV